MKRILVAALFCAAVCMSDGARAQSLQNLLNMFGGAKAARPAAEAGTVPTAEQLAGKWIYRAPEMVYSGDSSVALMAVASAKSQLPSMAAGAGLKAGVSSAEFADGGTAVFSDGEKAGEAGYVYDASSGRITFTAMYKDSPVSLSASVTLKEGVLTLLFDATEAAAAVGESAPELKDDTMFRMLKGVVDKYPGIKIGASFGR